MSSTPKNPLDDVDTSCVGAAAAVALTVLIVLSMAGSLFWYQQPGRYNSRPVAYNQVCRRYRRAKEDEDTPEGYTPAPQPRPGSLSTSATLGTSGQAIIDETIQRVMQRRTAPPKKAAQRVESYVDDPVSKRSKGPLPLTALGVRTLR
jgi:hypothetical protein